MRGLPAIASAEAFRVRRWDVLILGTALPGLAAAARLGQRGLRVMVLQEGATDPALERAREPFLLSDGGGDGVLAQCLRALGVPLIDQRRFAPEDVALQVCDAERRIDLGRAGHTAEELESWGLCSRAEARSWLQALDDAAERERAELLTADLSLGAARRAREVIAAPRRAVAQRGWPAALEAASPELRRLLDAPLEALAPGDGPGPAPEVRARLLGGLLRGGVAARGEGGLRGLLRRRVETLYGEIRPLERSFHLVSVSNQPGLAVEGSKEIWSGRVLVLNAPPAALAAASGEPPPEVLQGAPLRWRRLTLHFQGEPDLLPPSMAERVLWRPDAGELVALRAFRGRRKSDPFDLFASLVIPTGDTAAEAHGRERIEACLRDLLPFSEDGLHEQPLPERRWDSDALLSDTPRAGWPAEPQLRLSSRPPIFHLDRHAVAGLGGEGEMWLGWRAGDAIAEELG